MEPKNYSDIGHLIAIIRRVRIKDKLATRNEIAIVKGGYEAKIHLEFQKLFATTPTVKIIL